MKPFNLESAIAGWRSCLLAQGSWSPEIADELESHLRDEIETRMKAGESGREAFTAAVASIGDVGSLQLEFAKLNANRVLSKVVRVALPLTGLAVLVSSTCTFLEEVELSPLQRFAGLGVGLGTALYLGALPRWLRSFRPAAYVRFAAAVKLSTGFVFLWPVYALLQVLHTIPFELPILPTMVLWCFYASIALTVVLLSVAHGRGTNGGTDAPPGLPVPGTDPLLPSGSWMLDRKDATKLMQRFQPAARSVLNAAREEARRLGHDFIGTEHVLLGILKSEPEAVREHLRRFQLQPERVIREVERAVRPVPVLHYPAGPPFTSRVNRAFRLAFQEAEARNRQAIGPEHILLGLLEEREGVAGQVLRKLGLQICAIRERVC